MIEENLDQREGQPEPNSVSKTGGGAVLDATPCSLKFRRIRLAPDDYLNHGRDWFIELAKTLNALKKGDLIEINGIINEIGHQEDDGHGFIKHWDTNGKYLPDFWLLARGTLLKEKAEVWEGDHKTPPRQ
jgi:hypothetical protein